MRVEIRPLFEVSINGERSFITGSVITIQTMVDLPPLPHSYIEDDGSYNKQWVFLGIDILSQLRSQSLGTIFSKGEKR